MQLKKAGISKKRKKYLKNFKNMKLRLVILSLLCFSIVAINATRRALVIGIGDYPENSGWHKINGDKDIPLVEETLMTNGFSKKDIIKLKNQEATCHAIKRELESLIAKSQSGDYVYIHFSGHGQQITDLNGDEEDGLDEAWIPYDAQFAYAKGKYEGQNHLVDDQLNQYLHRLRERVGKEGKIVVVADACHSGSGSRSEEDEEYIVRGTPDAFVIPAGTKKATSTPSHAIEWTFISACKPYQCNYEYKGNGSLTYALHQQRNSFAKLSAKQIEQRIRDCISKISRRIQTPIIETAIGKESDVFF